MKRSNVIAFLCAAAMTFSLTACQQQTAAAAAAPTAAVTATETSYAGKTLAGQVTAIDGTNVTLQLGELTEDGRTPPDGETPPEKPDGSSDSAPGQSGGAPSSGTNSTPPEKPDGSSDSAPGQSGGAPSNDTNGTPPELPDGNAPGGSGFTAGEESVVLDFSKATLTKNGESIQLSDLSEGDILTVTVGEGTAAASAEVQTLRGFGGPGGAGGDSFGGGAPGGFDGSSEVTQGESATTLSEDGTYSGETYTSTGDDENALRIDGAAVTLSGIAVEKSAGATSNTENGDFYGMNAALLATNGATVTIENATVTSSAQNGNGVFSYGSGTTVNISDSTITTTADNSGGIQTTGGGTVNVDGGTYTSNGYNSPAVYSTADITVKNAVLTANNSEALVIEGKNSIALENCTVTGNMSDTQGASSDENVHNVMIYQSMSGDADVGTSVFSMTGGSLTAKNGDMFYVTNTHCLLTLSGVTLENEDADGALLRVVGNSATRGWGTAGSNGAQVEFTADGQTLSGDIIVDSISTLTMTLKNGSAFTGTINVVENAEGGAAVENNAAVTIEEGCTWTLTGDCTLSTLVNNGTINFNGHTITLADGTVLK